MDANKTVTVRIIVASYFEILVHSFIFKTSDIQTNRASQYLCGWKCLRPRFTLKVLLWIKMNVWQRPAVDSCASSLLLWVNWATLQRLGLFDSEHNLIICSLSSSHCVSQTCPRTFQHQILWLWSWVKINSTNMQSETKVETSWSFLCSPVRRVAGGCWELGHLLLLPLSCQRKLESICEFSFSFCFGSSSSFANIKIKVDVGSWLVKCVGSETLSPDVCSSFGSLVPVNAGVYCTSIIFRPQRFFQRSKSDV